MINCLKIRYNSGLEYISRNATAEEFLVFSEIRPFLSLISSLSVFKKSTQHLICFFNEHETLLPSIVRLSKLLRSDSLFGSDEAMLCVEYVLEFMNNVCLTFSKIWHNIS